jgi:ubiquinone biosynthesis monooxygenase Coq7
MRAPRRLTATDRLLASLQQTLQGRAAPPARRYPAAQTPAAALTPAERRRAAGLMRINHAGEVSAQGLYHGQALTAHSAHVARHLKEAAAEERDHMAWCAQRLEELHSHPSRLAPLWYGGAFVMGAAAGLAGDRWNLGFVAETEQQVAAHLDDHLARLPPGDARSRAVVQAMRADEARHGENAVAAGGAALPAPLPWLMRQSAKIMKRVAYHF